MSLFTNNYALRILLANTHFAVLTRSFFSCFCFFSLLNSSTNCLPAHLPNDDDDDDDDDDDKLTDQTGGGGISGHPSTSPGKEEINPDFPRAESSAGWNHEVWMSFFGYIHIRYWRRILSWLEHKVIVKVMIYSIGYIEWISDKHPKWDMY